MWQISTFALTRGIVFRIIITGEGTLGIPIDLHIGMKNRVCSVNKLVEFHRSLVIFERICWRDYDKLKLFCKNYVCLLINFSIFTNRPTCHNQDGRTRPQSRANPAWNTQWSLCMRFFSVTDDCDSCHPKGTGFSVRLCDFVWFKL